MLLQRDEYQGEETDGIPQRNEISRLIPVKQAKSCSVVTYPVNDKSEPFFFSLCLLGANPQYSSRDSLNTGELSVRTQAFTLGQFCDHT